MKLYSPSYLDDPFNLFDEVIRIKKITDIKPDGCVILWGGEDIYPGIYNQKPNMLVNAYKLSARDKFEMEIINHCIKMDIPMIGICRGAQLLCCMAGGKLLQHIEDHGFSHNLVLHDEGDVVITCNSSHHQMMQPPTSAKILATAKEPTNGLNEHNNFCFVPKVNEVVWFPTIRALGIQPHPEWTNSPAVFNSYCQRKVKEYIYGQTT